MLDRDVHDQRDRGRGHRLRAELTAVPASSPSSSGSGSPRPRRADALRNEKAIAEAAMRVLAEHPGASMAEIAKASGLVRATLYRHFDSREDLVRAIQGQATEAGAAALAAADIGAGDAASALRRAIRALVGVGSRYRLLAQEPALDPTRLEREPAVASRLIALIERGQREGDLRDDLPVPWIVSVLAALLVVALREMEAERLTRDQAAEQVASTLLEGLAARRAPDR
ncbi:MAG: helix-turn-helix domain-containing protein [Solirubrobacterales bacterium]